jgi:predicted nicotinamide N-methyase
MKQIYLTHLAPVLSLVIYLVNYNKRIFRALAYTTLFLLSNISYSQSQASISGKVIDESTGQALPGTTVIIEGTTNGTIADYDGNFTIKDVPTGTYNLIANFVSYKKMTQEVTVESGQNYDYTVIADFALFYDQLMMDQVVVTGIASKNSRATSAVAVQRIDENRLLS